MNRIAFIHTYFPYGGGEKVTIDIANTLLAREKDMEIFVLAENFFAEKLMPVADAERFHVLTPKSPAGKNKKAFVEHISECIKKYHIEVAISVGVNIAGMAEAIQSVGCRALFANHGMPFWEIAHKRMIASKLKNRGFWGKIAYYLLRYIRYEKTDYLQKRFYGLYRSNISRFDAYIVLCDEYRQEIIDTLHTVGDKIYAISNMQVQPASVCLDKKRQFLYVGRLSYADKRVDRLVEAWKRVCGKLPEWELVIVGDGKESASLRAMAEGLEHIRFEGYQKDVERYYKTASALCLVSNHESWGLCLTEAQANGVVPIAMECSAGVRSIVEPSGENGFLVPNGDVEAFAQRMIDFASLPEDERMKLRHNVVRKSMDYSPERIGNQWLALFEKLSSHR